MSPIPEQYVRVLSREVTKPTNPNGLVLEAWAEGYMVGSLIIMSCITLANMRRGVLLHKLILLELVLGYWQGFFILFNPPIYAWWLSVAAIPLNISWVLHNIISWMKLRPFLSKPWSLLFIGTICLSMPYWVVEIYANFTYFHNVNDVFLHTRPWEALCRDPWWIVAAIVLLYNIKTKYDLSAYQIARISPRFAVMLGAMLLSIAFIILDVLSVTSNLKSALPTGINPFWKLSFVFKCLTDSVVLDDFKTALDRLRAFKISRLGSFAVDNGDSRMKEHSEVVQTSNNWAEPPDSSRPVPVGKLPSLPPSEGDTSPHTNTRKKANVPSSVSVEDKQYAGITRTASRDRDIEENGIQALDYGNLLSPDDRQASDVPMMAGHDEHWPPPRRESRASTADLDLELEYAMAVREVTHDSSYPKSSQGTGKNK